jgi:hypothetical protein
MNARYKQSVEAQVLEQLQIAHAVILNAVALMTSEQKRVWAKKNVEAGIHPEDGLTGFNARAVVLKRAVGEPS